MGAYLAARLAHSSGDTKAAAAFYGLALDYDPENADLMRKTFTLMVAEGHFDQALPLALRMVALDSDSPLPTLTLGVRDVRDGRLKEAEARFANLPKRGGIAFLGPLMTAWVQAAEGRTDDALASLASLAQNPALKALHAFHAGLILDLAGRDADAQAQYAIALAGQSGIRPIEAAGSLFQRTGHPDQARALYDAYQAEHPDTLLFDGAELLAAGTNAPRPVADAKAGIAEAMFDLSTLVRQGSSPDYALVFCRLGLELTPDFPLAQLTLADLLSAQGRLTEANALYRAIDPATPAYALGQVRMAVNLDDGDDTEGAVTALEALAKSHPAAVDPLITLGDILSHRKRYDGAVQAFTRALGRTGGNQPRYWSVHYSRGVAYDRLHQWPKAEADFITALKLKPDASEVLNYLGYSWIDLGINLEQGRAMIEKAVALNPRDGAVVDSLGWALYRTGDFTGAVRELEHAVELRPEDSTINEHLGDAYWQVGRSGEARLQWQRAMSLDPDPDQIAPLQEKVRTGRLPDKPVSR